MTLNEKNKNVNLIKSNDNRIDNIVEAIKKQTEISNTLYEMIKAKS